MFDRGHPPSGRRSLVADHHAPNGLDENCGGLKSNGARLILAIAPLLAIILTASCEKKAPAPTPPVEVGVDSVRQQDVPVTGDWVATLDGYENAQIQPQVSGYVIRQTYREGSLVHKGQVLFEIDPRPFRASLDQAKGQLAVAVAGLAQAQGQLGQSEAQAVLADINVNRDTPLAKAHAIAQSQLDTDTQTQATSRATIKTQQAGIKSAQANIQSAQAAVQSAEINLNFTRVLSLIDGIAGIATVQIGNFVTSTSVLTTVSQVNPIKAYFPISEQEYMHVVSSLQGKKGDDWLKRSASVPLTLTLADGAVYSKRGRIRFTDRQVDNQTGAIRIVGAFENPGNILRPGQYGRISAVTNVRKNALLVPQRAVTQLQDKYEVSVVDGDNKVNIHTVSVGERYQSMWVVLSGLTLQDRIITEGNGKVHGGALVTPKPDNSGDLPK